MDDKHGLTPRGTLSKLPRLAKPDRRVNPFERDLIRKLHRLHLPVWSPSIMQCPDDTPPQHDWAIDEISKLNPTNIEESPSTHQESESLSQEVEAKVQAQIQEFFTNHPLPSPVVKEPKDKYIGTSCDGSAELIRWTEEDDDENMQVNTALRRKLVFSFEEGMDEDADMSLKSGDINIVQHHGALIVSPNAYQHPGHVFMSPTSIGSTSHDSFGNLTQEMMCSTPSN